jgi:hypothetical protein
MKTSTEYPRLVDLSVRGFVAAVGSAEEPLPAGGSVAALTGASSNSRSWTRSTTTRPPFVSSWQPNTAVMRATQHVPRWRRFRCASLAPASTWRSWCKPSSHTFRARRTWM